MKKSKIAFMSKKVNRFVDLWLEDPKKAIQFIDQYRGIVAAVILLRAALDPRLKDTLPGMIEAIEKAYKWYEKS